MPPKFLFHIRETVLKILPHPSAFLYVAVTLSGIPFQGILSLQLRIKRKSCYTTSPCHYWQDSVCIGLFSLAVTSSIPLVSFPAGTKTFPFPALLDISVLM